MQLKYAVQCLSDDSPTICFLFVRKLCNQCNSHPDQSFVFSPFKALCGTESKALQTLKNIVHTSYPMSKACRHVFVIESRAEVVERPGMIPHWLGEIGAMTLQDLTDNGKYRNWSIICWGGRLVYLRNWNNSGHFPDVRTTSSSDTQVKELS